MIRFAAYGLDAALKMVLTVADAVSPSSISRVTAFVGTQALRDVQAATHAQTGTLKGAHDVALDGPRAVLYVRPIRNPRSKQTADRYAGFERGRGGEHDFYQSVLGNDRVAIALERELLKELP